VDRLGRAGAERPDAPHNVNRARRGGLGSGRPIPDPNPRSQAARAGYRVRARPTCADLGPLEKLTEPFHRPGPSRAGAVRLAVALGSRTCASVSRRSGQIPFQRTTKLRSLLRTAQGIRASLLASAIASTS
jgi:hypothetical protein